MFSLRYFARRYFPGRYFPSREQNLPGRVTVTVARAGMVTVTLEPAS